MKRWIKELFFDLQEPGINIWSIPIISMFFVLGSYLLQGMLGNSNTVTLSVLELLIPFMGGYASIMIMQGLLDTEGCEILYTYDRSYMYWGVYRQFRLFAVQVVHTALVCISIAAIMRVSFLPLLCLTLVQSFAVMAISFLGVSISRRVSVGLIILISFVGVQITLGREISFLNWLFVLSGRLPEYEILVGIYFRSIIISIFGWIIGQVWIHP